MDLKNKTVLVAGTGISGIGACRLLDQVGANIILYDSNKALTREKILERLPERIAPVTIVIGDLPQTVIEGLDLAVLSPGVPVDTPFVCRIRAAGVPVWGEVELAYNYSRGTLAGITGTNGKTTTTALTGEIMKAWSKQVFVVGNIGNSYTASALETDDTSVTVAELSSFQLETIENFRPKVSAVLNITPDHLDRHHTMQGYIEAKKRIFENQKETDFTVLNYDDEETYKMAGETKAQVIFFSSHHVLEDGYYFQNGEIIYAVNGQTQLICRDRDLNILGLHNMENVMAAVAVSHALGVPFDVITGVLKCFKGVEHRIEYVTQKRGVAYYNDSKGTNTDAAVKAIEAMVRPTLLIGGGYDKHVGFDDWIKAFKGKVRYLVLLGQTADQIEQCAKKYGFMNVIRAESLAEAVNICAQYANEGDAVLLSPACASWGMFTNYEERGRMFKDYVRKLPD